METTEDLICAAYAAQLDAGAPDDGAGEGLMRLPDEVKGPYPDWRDCWLGLFIDPSPERVRLYIILVPCFPVRLTWKRR